MGVTGYVLRVTGYGLRVTGYGLRVTGYGLRVTGYGLRVTGYGVTGYGLRVTGLRGYGVVVVCRPYRTVDRNSSRRARALQLKAFCTGLSKMCKKPEVRRQESEWAQKQQKSFCIGVSRMRLQGVQNAGVKSFAPLAGPANAGVKSMEPETKTYAQRLSKVSEWS